MLPGGDVMPFESPSVDPERLFMFGGPGAGKTFAGLTVARMLMRTKSDVRFWIIDTDRAIGRMLEDPAFEGVGRYVKDTYFTARRWEDSRKAVDKITDKVSRGDWIMVDFFSKLWTQVQNYFIRAIYETTPDRYAEDIRKGLARGDKEAKKKQRGGGFEGFMDWPYINKIYGEPVDALIWSDANIFYTAEAGRIGDDDPKEVKELYGDLGVKPTGQKLAGHQAQTIILGRKGRKGRTIQCVKDRSREHVWAEEAGEDEDLILPWRDLAKDYLMDVAGWTK